MLVGESTAIVVAGVPPNSTATRPVKFVPVIVTGVPPAMSSVSGNTPVTVGAAIYVNSSADDVPDVPYGVTTVTSTTPTVPAGAVAVICVAESTVKLLAAVPPKLTAVAPFRLVPVTTTMHSPASGPLLGLTAVTVGAVALYVN